MEYGKEIRPKQFVLSNSWDFVGNENKFLAARTKPEMRFNIIGTGTIGQEHIAVTHIEGRAAVHGLYDPNAGSRDAAIARHAAFKPSSDMVIYDSLEAACHDPAADALIICTPNYTHLEVIKTAVKSGKPILLEKPIATTVADAWELTQIAEGHDNIFQIGLQYRYKAIYVEAFHEAQQRRSLGNLHMIGIREHRVPFLDKVLQWNKFTRYTGDTLVEKCCHYFDLLNQFADARPVDVYATGSQAVNFKEFEMDGVKSDILDNALCIINYSNGVRASFELCMFAPMFREELVMCGDEGWLRAYENRQFTPSHEDETFLEVMASHDAVSRRCVPSYPELIQNSGHHGATYFEHIRFVDAIKGKPSDAATVREGLWSIVVASAAQESIKCGAVVNIDAYLAENGVPI